MNKNKLAIINCNWEKTNYGAVMTAYALQKAIDIHFTTNVFLINNVLTKFIVCNLFNNKFDKFKKKYCKSSSWIKNYTHFFALNKTFDTFITGSDQVFRPSLLGQNTRYQYFLDFVKPDCKKIACSASFGVDKETFLKENSQEILDKMKQSLKSFDFISVREKSGVEICRDILGIEAEWIIDPVFMIERSIYEKIAISASAKFENEIVSYILSPRNNNIIKKYENKNNCKIKQLFGTNLSIEEWLYAIKDCKLLITDSFHGVCFAIIFNKPFICIVNSSTGSTRYDSIFEMLGIENQCIYNIKDIEEKDCIFNVDYEKVNKNIEKQRQKGLNFLKRSLEAKSNKKDEKQKVYEYCFHEREFEKKNYIKCLKDFFWLTWLFVFYNILPETLRNIIRLMRDRLCK